MTSSSDRATSDASFSIDGIDQLMLEQLQFKKKPRKEQSFIELPVNYERHLSKPYSSKHVVGLQTTTSRHELVQIPPAAKSVPFGQNRKRGKPTKAEQALLLQ